MLTHSGASANCSSVPLIGITLDGEVQLGQAARGWLAVGRPGAIPPFGYKNHVSADREHGLTRKWLVTDTAAHDGTRLPELLDKTSTASGVWADTAC
jgi:hypothetical protein